MKLLFILLLVINTAVAQIITIPLDRILHESPTGEENLFTLISLKDDIKHFKGIKKDSYTYYTIKYLQVSNLKMDSCNSRIYFLIGMAKNGDKEIIIDNNRDFDFNDDKKLIYSSEFREKARSDYKTDLLSTEVAYHKNDKVLRYKVYYRIMPFYSFLTNGTDIEQKIDISIVQNEYFKGSFNFKGKDLSVLIMPNSLQIQNIKNRATVYIIDASKKLDKDQVSMNMRNEGEYIFADSLKFGIGRISKYKDTLVLKYEGIEKDSTAIGNIAAGFSAKKIDGTIFNFDARSKSKYYLIDFWGTWCGPCKEIIPDLKRIADRYPQIEIISIAYERRPEDIYLLKNEIKNQKMTWINLYQIKGELSINLPVNRYNIKSYPTSFLLDENHKIIAKSSNVDEFRSKILNKILAITK